MRQAVHVSRTFQVHATSAESNVLSIAGTLGMRVKALSAFVAGSPVSALIRADMLSRHVEVEGPQFAQGGPWGYRHPINIADTGSGPRRPQVWNDRAGEVGQELDKSHFDLDRIFADEGVQILHMSGLVAALSDTTGQFCLDLAKAAHANGTRVCFDLNYRSSFWKQRDGELTSVFTQLAEAADILAGNEEDFQLALKLPGPESGGRDIDSRIESFQEMLKTVNQRFPQAGMLATTLRQVEDAGSHLWGAIVRSNEDMFVAKPRHIGVFDRIGGGDGFLGGLLYGVLRGWQPKRAMEFGWATGALAAASATDYAVPLSEEEVWAIWEGDARVKR
jgi:2-dehydro-3-deoxygluconokinase